MFFRSECFHRQRMNFLAHTVAECRVNELMTLYQSLADKGRRHDQRAEMLAIALDFKVRALKTAGNVVFNEIRCGQHDFAFVQK